MSEGYGEGGGGTELAVDGFTDSNKDSWSTNIMPNI